MKIIFLKTGELNVTSYVKIPSRSNAILNIKNIDKFCFLWSILAQLDPNNNTHPTRVKNYLKFFNEINIDGFDFTNGFKCSDVHRFIELKSSSINIYELNFIKMVAIGNII